MAERKLIQVQREAIPKMRKLGMSYRDIAEILEVSYMTVYRCVHPDRTPESMRHTTLGTKGPNGKMVVITGLNKRPHPGRCELCGRVGKRLAYHHWDNKEPSRGIWVSYKCHMIVELVDEFGPEAVHSMIDHYLELREAIEKEYNRIRAKEISRGQESYRYFLARNASNEQQSEGIC